MVTKATEKRFRELQEQLDNRDPDFHGMYIYNGARLCRSRSIQEIFALSYIHCRGFDASSDYFNYGQLDLMDKELSTIHARLWKKNFDEAYTLLEALSNLLVSYCSWPSEHLPLLQVFTGSDIHLMYQWRMTASAQN